MALAVPWASAKQKRAWWFGKARPSMIKATRLFSWVVLIGLCVSASACARIEIPPAPPATNLDAETQTQIQSAQRVVFLVPFSHWDTDWHEDYSSYSERANANILAAIQMAKQHPRFRFALEQVLFVQHFWDTHPEARADLKAAIQRRQLTFAWAGITQPETSLVAPAIQVRNLQLGEDWIAQTFGREFIPRVAWQSDAFGTSAIFNAFLAQANIPYLYIGRGPARCDPNDLNCKPIPRAFFWRTPVSHARVVIASGFYANAWGAAYQFHDEAQQLDALGKFFDDEFSKTTGKYALVPMGFDFLDPPADVPTLVEHWNAKNSGTLIVMSDPGTAFQYLATQPLPEINQDLNPIWQAFYATRPEAKITDKISAYYLTANDKFGTLVEAPPSSAWLTATMNAHYDNIGGVSFDKVWETAQRPRFQQTQATAANDLATTLARIASGTNSPALVFNPSSWQRSEIVEINDSSFDARAMANGQRINANTVAIYADAVPAIGFSGIKTMSAIRNPTSATQNGNRITLANGLTSITLDGARGGTMASLQFSNREFISGPGDDVTFIDDHGDVYGSTFGLVRAKQSEATTQMQILAQGPLVARAQIVFVTNGLPMTKTITLRADSSRIDVALDARAIPGTTALVQMSTTISTTLRTDDLGFGSITHEIDARPIISGDVTYRRKIFYPTMYWSDVSNNDAGLTLITQGLQGIAGTSTLNFMLVRDVTERDEGVTDREYHTFRYAYLPHGRQVSNLPTAAFEFNEPLIPVWRANNQIAMQLPFENRVRQFPIVANAKKFPNSVSVLSSESGIVADLFSRNGAMNALVLDYNSESPATIHATKTITREKNSPYLIPIDLPAR